MMLFTVLNSNMKHKAYDCKQRFFFMNCYDSGVPNMNWSFINAKTLVFCASTNQMCIIVQENDSVLMNTVFSFFFFLIFTQDWHDE